MMKEDTIVALATPPGRGGIGVVRVSGPLAKKSAQLLTGQDPKPRYAHYGALRTPDGELIDQGLVIFFPAPHSFTGESVTEFQIHGGPIIIDRLIEYLLSLGLRLAEPGEFSQRAFLNNKIDLVQAEAIADLINATSRQAAEQALNSLQGAFSCQIHQLVEQLIFLRAYVEAAIDFPEEEDVDYLASGQIAEKIQSLLDQLQGIQKTAQQGVLMQEGMTVVLAGRPNAGKSSLLNHLCDHERALVTDIAGTTRDLLKESIHIDGMPLHIIDTAGLRETEDPVEKLGVAKAWQAIEKADRILLLVDAQTTASLDPKIIWPEFVERLPDPQRLTLIRNKIDLTGETPESLLSHQPPVIRLSIKQNLGFDALKQHLKKVMGFEQTTEGCFMARRRHLQALKSAENALIQGLLQLNTHQAGELLAEDLRLAQEALNQITGDFSADDLLGKIFGEFCIGK